MSRSTPVSRRAFLHQASAFSALAGVGGPLALNLAAMGNAAAQSRHRLQGAGLHLPVRRQRRLQHGAAHRRALVGRLRRHAQPRVELEPRAEHDCAGEPRHAGRADGAARLAGASGRRAADRAHHHAGPNVCAASLDAAGAGAVQRCQAAGRRCQRRAAAAADEQGAVQEPLAPQAAEPVLAQRSAEHLAGVRARRRNARLGRPPGRHADVAERHRGPLHGDLGRRQCRLAQRCRRAPVPGEPARRHPHGRLRLGRRAGLRLRLGAGGPRAAWPRPRARRICSRKTWRP